MCIGIEQSIRIIDSLSTRRVEGLLIFHCTSRRLLATAQALEAGWSFPPWVPPSDKRYLSCALNVFTTELSVADAAVADQFVYYARRPTAPTGASGASAAAAAAAAAALLGAATYGDRDANADDGADDANGWSHGSTVSTMKDLRSNPWALGAIAGALSFIVLGFLAVLLRRESGKSDEPLLDTGIDEKEMPPAAVAVAVTEVVEEDAAISDDDRIAKEKVQRMVEAEQRARRIQAAAGVRFRSGDDSLLNIFGRAVVPQFYFFVI